ncbi:MAG: molybdopterin-synthase adenylyltransferase MoeB [Rhodothermaceae bacterium]|nr:molybdopterin-synthase adenylyltransferase MoeB [Bacteroidota bacterium]MXX97648.1 molybdopterin-synthase adenylyltransferase MoeB [Rhodothermaceae bacterium]MXZ57965.1 molybdopterin-synthase adenylyltransferase MoeB [Rhodothermaceae bacterium]MYB90954.1 molybdopterin-synthase adenylyltransferase MoeB [Rhodothermaceae bacterium]MYD67657.1 molybdopterin-synthase adenylyltransferase MoeB [Rhodothermaceae bacterium]
MLNQAEHLRYSRQISLNELGVSGQQKLKESSVAIVGAGGLGSPLAFYLTAAGVGHLGIIDFDIVDASNLHRQILHTDEFIGVAKLESALVALEARNPYVKITRHDVRLQRDNAMEILGNYDVVADCSDNFATRYLVNDASVLLGIPNVYGSVYRFEGQITVFGDTDGPCYRCLHPAAPPAGLIPSCAESGVLGVLPGIIGTLQASEVLKLLLGLGQSLIGRMILINTLAADWQTLAVPKKSDCPLCGESPTIDALMDYEELCPSIPSIQARELKLLKQHDLPFFLLDVREIHEASAMTMDANLQIPLGELSGRLSEITADFNDRVIVHCQAGVRSKHAVQLLQSAGYTRAASLDGGILAWLEQKDEDP